MASTWTKRTTDDGTIFGRRFDPDQRAVTHFAAPGVESGHIQRVSAGIWTSLEARARNAHRRISQVEPTCWWTVIVHLTDGREVKFSGSGWNERQIQVLITRSINGKFTNRGLPTPSNIPWSPDLGTIDGPIASRF